MRVSRLYLDTSLSEFWSSQSEVVVSDDRAHYLRNVLRLEAGHDVILFDGNGGEYLGTIASIDKRNVTIHLESFTDENRVPRSEISLGLCVIKRDAMDNAIQKATELGVANIFPLVSDRVSVSSKQYANRQQHWRNVAISACEQCGMNRVPKVHEPVSLNQWVKTVEGRKICALPGGSQSQMDGTERPTSLLVGPEGGFSDDEIQHIQASGFSGIDLGNRILRAETAVISLMTLAVLA